jgi:hypothetical protein
MTKKKVREAAEATAFHSPFFTLSDVATQYALDHRMDISAPQDRFNMERDIEIHVPTHNSSRCTMSSIFDQYLKDESKVISNLPLKMGGVNTDGQPIKITVDEMKIVGRTELFVSEAAVLMFAGLRAVRKRLLHEQKTPTTAFDGYYSLNLVVWCLTQVAVDKKLVRNVGVYSVAGD